MKKIALLTCLFLYSFISHAQLEGPRVQQQNHNLFSGAFSHNSGFGFKGGVNFANMAGGDREAVWGSTDYMTSFHAGAFAQFSFNNSFSLQSEVLYSRKGFERQDTATYRFDYIEVPVLAVFNITENFSIHAGPQASLMILARRENQEVLMEPYNTFDYGIAAGAEARFGRFRLGGRYNRGFADLRKEDDAGQSINQDIKNNVFQIYLGVGF
ncbi:porin family protein [Pontibacter harenae]|uniref:porin family protein n=1 Tax=Pontibacter harenae TaxID=2894083 RepID=UPI001E4D4061|nr:porin family protein [Pontibacter harenae]MCC9166465.1 PorT family protein [Pontibacter harenae]